MYKRIFFSLGFVGLFFSSMLAQLVTGKVLAADGDPLVGAEIILDTYSAMTNSLGRFSIFDVASGSYTIKVIYDDKEWTMAVNIKTGENDLGVLSTDIALSPVSNDISVISLDLDEIEGEGDDIGQEFSSLLSAGRDPFDRAAAYNFSSGRFYPRGYNNEDRLVYLNGFAVNDLDDGRLYWGAWGGLNDVMRNQINNFSLRASDFSFGGIGGTSFIDLRASRQRPQTKIVINRTNRSYTNRLMVTHSSGDRPSGWSYAVAGSRRWGNEGYIEGTFYDAWSLFATVEKKINKKHSVGLTALMAPSNRGRFTGSIQEAYDLAGSNYYNANWGYQAGKKRNSRIYRTAQPIAIFRHDWKFDTHSTLTTVIAGQTGKFAGTRLDWYNANDPRPDYYRKLPSFYERIGLNDLAAQVRQKFLTDVNTRQINWDRFYFVNRNRHITVENANGSGAPVTGALSAYIVEEQHFDTDKFNANTTLHHVVNDRLNVQGGLNYSYENVHNFKVVDDLLGGEFYIDLDEFALRDFPDDLSLAQNDLQHPNRILKVGDRFGYNYDIVTQKTGGWAQAQYSLHRFDVFGAIEASSTSFFRKGFYQNGKFPNNSLGKSAVNSFFNYGFKTGLTYKLDGRNYFYGVGSIRTRAPFSRFAYLSPRNHDGTLKDLKSEDILGGEIGYVFRYTGFKGRLTAYYSRFSNQIENSSFYHDEQRTFVNFSLSGVDKQHQGIELGLEANLTTTWRFNFAAGIGANQYISRPKATITQDNNAQPLAEGRTIFIKNFYIPGPQQAYSAGLSYNSPKYWFATLTLNHFREIWLDFNPDRRTNEAVAGILRPENDDLFYRIIRQEKLPNQFTLDFFGGKSWRLPGRRYLFLNLSINNILNNKKFITGGFEQGRFDYRNKDVDRFPPRYFYAYGTNFSVGLSLRM